MAEQRRTTGGVRQWLAVVAGVALLTWPLGLGWVVITEQQDAALIAPVQQLQTSAARLGEGGLRLARGEAGALDAMAETQRAFRSALQRLEENLEGDGLLPRSATLEAGARDVAGQWWSVRGTLDTVDPEALARAAGAAADVDAAAAELADIGGELAALRVEQGSQPTQIYIIGREQVRAQGIRLALRELVAGEGRAEVMALRLRQEAETLARGIEGLRQGDPQRGVRRVGSPEGRSLLADMAAEVDALTAAARRLEAEGEALETIQRQLGAGWFDHEGVAATLARMEERLAERRERREQVACVSLAAGAGGLLLLSALLLVPAARVPEAPPAPRVERVGPRVAPPPRPPRRMEHPRIGRQRVASAFWPAAPRPGGDWWDALKTLQPSLQLALLDWFRSRDEAGVRVALFRLAEILARMEAAVRAAVEGEGPVAANPPPAAADLLEVLDQARVVVRLMAHQGERAGRNAERRYDVPRLLGQVERAIGRLAETGPGAGFELEAAARRELAELACKKGTVPIS